MAVGPRLEDYFTGAAGKLLSPVEASPDSSHQHEFNGARPLVELLGQPPASGAKRRFRTAYVSLADGAVPLVVDDTATWYDARANHPARTEYRFYYPAGNPVMERARPGDYVVIAVPREASEHELVVIVAPGQSSLAAQVETMFGLEPSERFDVETLKSGEDLTFTSRELLELLGYEVDIADEQFVEMLLARFGNNFPTTLEFSDFARSTLPDVSALDDPDDALLAWWEREEVLFRTLEKHIVGERINGAAGDVDEILAIAMSTFQRRKSRAGHALENHVEAVFIDWNVPYEAQAVTEGKVRPDFLIPGSAAYRDPDFPDARLHMLAVKSTCKDRWRQVISEARRIPIKHLLTLESPISSDQLREMRAHAVRLVVPAALHDRFGVDSRRLFTMSGLIEQVPHRRRPG